jgi:membrane-associated protein
MPHFDLEELIRAVGYVGMFAIIFAETGLLVGFFLPGDSLLFTAGFLASQDYLNIWILLPVCFVAAVVGDAVGYWIGHRFGRALYQRPDSRLFKQEHLHKAHEFFEKHGGKAIVLGRFMPIVRTFVPVVAGTAEMTYRHFATYNVVGAVAWAIGVTLAGYILGDTIPGIDKYLLPIIGVIIVASVLPSAYHIWRERSRKPAAEPVEATVVD